MRATPLHLFVVAILGLSTGCTPEVKSEDTTKDSVTNQADATVADLNTDELTSADVQQVVFSLDGVQYFNQWWTSQSYTQTTYINDEAQPGDDLLYMDLTDYTPSTGTWSVNDVQAGTTHPLFEITESDSAYPRLAIRELEDPSGIGDSLTLTSLSQGDEIYNFSVRASSDDSELAYCKSSNSLTSDATRECVDCIEVDGTAYAGALGTPADSNVYCEDAVSVGFGAQVVYNDGSTTHEEVVWWVMDTDPAPIVSNLADVSDGTTGGLSYDDGDEASAINLNTAQNADYDADYNGDGSNDLQFSDTAARSSSLRVRMYGCTVSDLLYVTEGVGWRTTNSDSKVKYGSTSIDEIRLTESPSFTSNGSWNSSTYLVTTYPVFGTPETDDYGDYCQIDFQFRLIILPL